MAAPLGNRNAVGNRGGGRPTVYSPEHVILARVGAEVGGGDRQLAMIMGISEGTLANWQRQHGEFRQAIADGREAMADAD